MWQLLWNEVIREIFSKVMAFTEEKQWGFSCLFGQSKVFCACNTNSPKLKNIDINNYLFGLMSITWMGWKSHSDLAVQNREHWIKLKLESLYIQQHLVSLLYIHIIVENMELGKGHKRRKKSTIFNKPLICIWTCTSFYPSMCIHYIYSSSILFRFCLQTVFILLHINSFSVL